MGYYPAFRRAIPQKEADSCMLLSRPPLPIPCGIGTLDLHISGTPLALILSQDQTLKKIRKIIS